MSEDLKSRLIAAAHGDGGSQWPRNPDGAEACAKIDRLQKLLTVATKALKSFDSCVTRCSDADGDVVVDLGAIDDLHESALRAYAAHGHISARTGADNDGIDQLERACTEWAETSQANYQRANKAEAEVVRLRKALEGLVTDEEDDPCWHDHHGYCQAHFLNDPCEMAEARQALKGGDDE